MDPAATQVDVAAEHGVAKCVLCLGPLGNVDLQEDDTICESCDRQEKFDSPRYDNPGSMDESSDEDEDGSRRGASPDGSSGRAEGAVLLMEAFARASAGASRIGSSAFGPQISPAWRAAALEIFCVVHETATRSKAQRWLCSHNWKVHSAISACARFEEAAGLASRERRGEGGVQEGGVEAGDLEGSGGAAGSEDGGSSTPPWVRDLLPATAAHSRTEAKAARMRKVEATATFYDTTLSRGARKPACKDELARHDSQLRKSGLTFAKAELELLIKEEEVLAALDPKHQTPNQPCTLTPDL